MRIATFYRNLSIRIHGAFRLAGERLTERILNSSFAARALGVSAIGTLPATAHAAKVGDMISDWLSAVKEGVGFVTYIFLLMGVIGVGYGCKLIMDKSNDRADVKTSHIVVSLVGGAFLCMLWAIIEILVSTSGGSSSDIGKVRSF